ncbi:DUF222 domain-containing protein [Glycomyces sp. NPDC046736]|uniref:HNH endonuclease signature motif containing protein n=1 Tax=Glycomyces sp. NPDC046736 TaxID=3155615 RepID=UPI0034014DC7
MAPQIESLLSELTALARHSRKLEAAALRATIAYTSAGLHKSRDGFSGIRDWICESFSFHRTVAGDIASVARLAPKFKALTEAALSGSAQLEAVAYASRRLEREGMAVYARVPFADGPVESPFTPGETCASPEELIREYCIHAPFAEVRDHLDTIIANLLDDKALLDDLSQQSLAWLEVNQRPDGMWDIDGRLTADTGALFANLLRTAVPPPRQDEADEDGVLPAASNRNAEALHQMLTSYGVDARAPKRHGHTATLTLTADVEVLRNQIDLSTAPERTPRLEGKPVAVSKARHLACEAGVIPAVFDYDKGEVLELGREERLPNTALRRKLELEQNGCAWSGCTSPVSWTEAHHVEHWIDGGKTNAENLILLCRFHHGRIHTAQWEVSKLSPGKAKITHTPSGTLDSEWAEDKGSSDFATGLTPAEFSPAFKSELNSLAAENAWRKAFASKAKTRKRFTIDQPDPPPQSPKLPTQQTESLSPIPF